MQLATVLTPMSDENLQIAAQCGVTQVVSRYLGPELADIQSLQRRVESFGIELSVIEGYLPIERIKTGEDDGQELAALKRLVRHMGEAGVPILCYNFMAGTDWVRTCLDARERGDAMVTSFDVADVHRAMSLTHDASSTQPIDKKPLSCKFLWEQLERLLNELLPVAEEAGVFLAMHPDDPPLPELLGKSRIMHNLAGFERLLDLAPSAHNGVCFCQGSFATMGVDIPAAIRQLGSRIHYVHFRDVRGNAESFVETFHDNGPTDMVAAMEAYREVGFKGPIRPDHVPQLQGEADGEPGYTMKGRLFAFGYLRALMQATDRPSVR